MVKKNDGSLVCHGVVCVLVACLGFGHGAYATESSPTAVPGQSADARYVWASSLTLRGGPDGKSKALAKLPLGTQVKLLPSAAPVVPYQETLTKLAANSESRAADVTLSGTWAHVRAQELEGWVSDVYLSRYPAPPAAKPSDAELDAEAVHARNVFGAKLSYAWRAGDNKAGASFQALRKKHPELGKDMASEEFSWSYAEFKSMGSYEQLNYRVAGGMYQGDTHIKDLPLSFNEAVLWGLQFGYFAAMDSDSKSSIGKFSGTFEAGRRLELGPADDDTSGFGYSRSIVCSAKACSLHRVFAD